VGAGYFEDVTQTCIGGKFSETALQGSTKENQFTE
jgi:isocitrate lyase